MPQGFKPSGGAGGAAFWPVRGIIISPLRQIGRILEKFHAFGWTAPILPTYCPDEGISSTDGDIEGQSVWRHRGNRIDPFIGLSAFSALR